MDTIIQKLWEEAPLIGFLAFILVAGYKKWWVWGYQLTEAQAALLVMKAERDKFFDLAWRGMESSRTAVMATEKAVDVLKSAQ